MQSPPSSLAASVSAAASIIMFFAPAEQQLRRLPPTCQVLSRGDGRLQSLQYLLPCSRLPLHDAVVLVPPAVLLLLLLPILLVLLLLLDLPTLQSSATGSRP